MVQKKNTIKPYWIDNKTLYKKLCEHDTEINTLEDLNKYQRTYFTIDG